MSGAAARREVGLEHDDAHTLAIERLSTAERVADALREQLLSGVYAPGTPLRDTELSARAGVSRTTVREALAQLAREGLLTHSLHRGMEVARLASADVRDIYATRRLIERAGAEALLAGVPEALAALERAVLAMATATARRDRRRVVEADTAFHTVLGEALGVRRLRQALVGALLELRLVLSVTDRDYDDLADQLAQHQALLKLFQDRRLEVTAAIDEHLTRAEALVCASIEGVSLLSGGAGFASGGEAGEGRGGRRKSEVGSDSSPVSRLPPRSPSPPERSGTPSGAAGAPS